ncbi:hypothetical protein CC86DRAFT_430773 [Ophiobolus disseminans]|uniref:Uncharacterized protein n=1 Tax=Ophiobolus disseminans TaxID=1469910 RepID=A0A6A7ACQ3_9PLEO|nr:hypothetical protein CC86DRAFT_430773 [Ophiobolus disseminans]
MAPATRAATKRLRDGPKTDTTASGQNKKARTTAKSASRKKSKDTTDGPSQNAPSAEDSKPLNPAKSARRWSLSSSGVAVGIYDFAEESCNEGYAFSPYSTKVHHYSILSRRINWAERLWKFFGLTHTCKQLRAEYRPLWVRKLCMRITPSMLPAFIDAYLSGPIQQLHIPRLIQISWHHDMDNISTKDSMPMLQLHAHCPTVRFHYIPYILAEMNTGPGDEMCDHCCEVMYMEERAFGDADDVDGHCTCVGSEMDGDEWSMYQEDFMDYTEILDEFITNANEKWCQDLRDERMTVKHSFTRDTNHLTFRILVKEELAGSAGNFGRARDLLKEWGIFDLPRRRMMDFVLAFDKENEKMMRGCVTTMTMVREVKFARPKR